MTITINGLPAEAPGDPRVSLPHFFREDAICPAPGMADALRQRVPRHAGADLPVDTFILSHDELRERMSGNFCRCGACNGIAAAIVDTSA